MAIISLPKEVSFYFFINLRISTSKLITKITSIINIVTATEKAGKIHPTISEINGIAIAKLR